MEETANIPNLPRLSVRSANKYFMTIRALFNWTVGQNLLTKSPADVLRDLDEGDAQSARLPFSDEDLKLFFANLPPEIETRRRGCGGRRSGKKNIARYWVPYITAFQGCRLKEAAQLHAEDVKEVRGILCFDFNEESPDKNLKNESSHRTVPVHPRLIELGLREFVREVGSALLTLCRKTR